jgi:hypothetical protein
MQASQLSSIPGLDYLNAKADMTLTPTVGSGNFETVAEFIIPRGEARKFLREAGRLTLGSKSAFNGDGATTVFTLPANVSNNARAFTPPAALYFVVAGVKVFKVYTANPAPGAGQFTVLFPNQVKTGDIAAAGVNNVVVYYPPTNSDGKYTIEVFNPPEKRHETYGNGATAGLHRKVQDDINSPWTMNETPWIVQDYLIRVQVASLIVVDTSLDNPFLGVELPFVRKGIGQVTKQELAELVQTLGQ